jgi:hypothetical protein
MSEGSVGKVYSLNPSKTSLSGLLKNYGDCSDHLIFENVAISPVDAQVTLFRVPGQTALPGQKMQDSLTVTSMHAEVVAKQGGVAPDALERVVVPALTLDALNRTPRFFRF